jgi:hypothetical protein
MRLRKGPNPPKITREQAQNLAEALARGEPSRKRIALSIGRDALDEKVFAASPHGIPERLKERVTEPFSRGDDEGGSG